MAIWTPTFHVDGNNKSSADQNTNESDLTAEINGNIDDNNVSGFPTNNIGRNTITHIIVSSAEDENLPPLRMPGHRFGSQVGPHGYLGANIINLEDDDLVLNDPWRTVPGMSSLVPIDRYGKLSYFGYCMFALYFAQPDPPGSDIKSFPCVEHPHHAITTASYWRTSSRHRIAAPNSTFEFAVFIDDVIQSHTTRRFGASCCVSADGYSYISDSQGVVGAVNDRNFVNFSNTADTYEEPAQRSGGKAFYQISSEFDFNAPASNRVAKVELKFRPIIDDVIEYFAGNTNSQDITEMREYRFRMRTLGLYISVYSANLSCMLIKQDPSLL